MQLLLPLRKKIDKKQGELQLFNEHVDLIPTRKLIQKTIEVCYPGCYDDQVVEYFKDYNKFDKILLRAKNGFILVYKYNKMIVGTGCLLKSNIEALFVDPLYQFNGIGRKIVHALIYEASSRNQVRLTVNSTPGALPFFQKLGFSVISEEIKWVNDYYPITFYRMRKLF